MYPLNLAFGDIEITVTSTTYNELDGRSVINYTLYNSGPTLTQVKLALSSDDGATYIDTMMWATNIPSGQSQVVSAGFFGDHLATYNKVKVYGSIPPVYRTTNWVL